MEIKSFLNLNLDYTYNTEDNDLLNEFYIPVIAVSKRYDRAVGYFSAGILKKIAVGLISFIESNGKMRLIIGEPLDKLEYDAINIEGNEKLEQLEGNLIKLFESSDDKGILILKYLVVNKQLEIKFALRRRGMFHQKIGALYDESNNVIVFQGSANETPSAYLDCINSEQISVYPSWTPAYETHGVMFVNQFENIWNNKTKNTNVIALNSEAYQKISDNVDIDSLRSLIFPKEVSSAIGDLKDSDILFSYDFEEGVHEPPAEYLSSSLEEFTYPKIPEFIGNNAFQLFRHQKIAIDNWFKGGCVGLFKLATGSGKTFTSICSIVQLFNQRLSVSKPTFVIISVPYIELANQWVKELSIFNIRALRCYESAQNWSDDLYRKISLFTLNELMFSCVVVVNATLRSNIFQKRITMIPKDSLFFIGDECHHLGGQSLSEKLPEAKFRLGLSATPFKHEKEEIESPFLDSAKENLLKYFREVTAEYSLQDAISDDVLSPYTYNIVPVYLTFEEQETYDELSESILKLMLKSRRKALDSDEKQILTSICGKRSRLLATCDNKIPALSAFIKQSINIEMLKHALFYVGEGHALDDDVKFLNKVAICLLSMGVKVSKFTSAESSKQRKKIMDDFVSQHIDGLVAMKVLDEGIDVPVCETAFILASTRNPRQYVQRRGRVLRKAKGKTTARIIDFVVLPNQGRVSKFSANLKKSELERVEDFMNTSSNITEVKSLIEGL